jgi:hypothetical protein
MFMTAFTPYNTLPVADEALDRGGVELLRVGLADEELFITLRSPFPEPDQWGRVLADVTRHLADLYSTNSNLTGDNVISVVAQAYAQTLRLFVKSSSPATKGARPAKSAPAKSARPGKAPSKKAKVLAKRKAKVKSPAKAKVKSKSGSKAAAGRKGARG